MRIGRDKIQIVRDELTPDGVGGNTKVRTVVREPVAMVEQVEISTDVLATQQNVRALYEVSMRYNPDNPVLAGDKILWRGFTLIALTPEPNRLERKMKVRAYAETETSNR